jgi:hypothetical protein
MTPEQRELRSAELQHEISREWLRYAIVDGVVLAALAAVLAWGVLTDSIAESALVPIAIVGGVLCGLLVTYWVLARIRPLQREREGLERYDRIATTEGEL